MTVLNGGSRLQTIKATLNSGSYFGKAAMTEVDLSAVPEMWHAIPRMVSDISEEFYCAGWLIDCEFSVWRMMQEGGTWGMGSAGQIPETLGALRSIAQQTGYWVHWDADADPPEQPIPLAEWEPLYAEWAARRDAAKAAHDASRCGAPCRTGGTCRLDAGHDGDHFESFLESLVARR